MANFIAATNKKVQTEANMGGGTQLFQVGMCNWDFFFFFLQPPFLILDVRLNIFF